MNKPKIIVDPTLFIIILPIVIGLTLTLGIMDINGSQTIFKKLPLETFQSWDCDLQLKYLASTIPPETHRQSYIDNCVEKKP